eukprot:1157086-Pelagomonas_calceolata.AAC.1
MVVPTAPFITLGARILEVCRCSAVLEHRGAAMLRACRLRCVGGLLQGLNARLSCMGGFPGKDRAWARMQDSGLGCRLCCVGGFPGKARAWARMQEFKPGSMGRVAGRDAGQDAECVRPGCKARMQNAWGQGAGCRAGCNMHNTSVHGPGCRPGCRMRKARVQDQDTKWTRPGCGMQGRVQYAQHQCAWARMQARMQNVKGQGAGPGYKMDKARVRDAGQSAVCTRPVCMGQDAGQDADCGRPGRRMRGQDAALAF